MAGQSSSLAASTPPRWSGRGRIDRPYDVPRILAEINAAGGVRASTMELRRAVGAAAELHEPDAAGHLAVHPLLVPLLPWPAGLRRGATVAALGSTSLVFALLAGAMSGGGYAAIVGLPSVGAVAAAEQGVPLERLALVPDPGSDWLTVVAALVDGLDMVVVATPADVPAGVLRALAARARLRGAVLVPLRSWVVCDLTLTATGQSWWGLGTGRGRLRRHEITVSAVGRGSAARRREVTVPIPLAAPGGPPEPRQLRPGRAAHRADLSA